MKKLLVILFSTFTLAAVAQQQKIAVYVTASEGIDEATKQIVGSELVTAITTNPDYNAVERTDEFLKEIKKEHSYQRSGNVDDQQISELGKQFGVNTVCVANVMPFKDSYYINARLIDVEEATVKASASATSISNTLEDFVSACEALASKLFGKQVENLEVAGPKGQPVGRGTNGNTWSLAGRECKYMPRPSNNFKQEGKVVVGIQVDAAGNVIAAYIANGTTVTDYSTQQIALKAARETKFSSSSNNIQIGTISYIFKFK